MKSSLLTKIRHFFPLNCIRIFFPQFPMTCYMACGTQTDGKPNQLILMKMSKLSKVVEDSMLPKWKFSWPYGSAVNLLNKGRFRLAQIASSAKKERGSHLHYIVFWLAIVKYAFFAAPGSSKIELSGAIKMEVSAQGWLYNKSKQGPFSERSAFCAS